MDTESGQRLRSLDGLRGVAALTVVLHHLSLLSGAISDHYLVPGAPPLVPGTPHWFVTSVLGLNLLAITAVLVFFVLSGVVLTLPALRDGFDWFAYYPRRILRLVLPVIASLILAYLLAVLTPQDPATAGSGWASAFSFTDPDPWLILSGSELLAGDPSLNNPLWSLRYELLFSLLLPAAVLVALAVRRWWVVAIVLCIAAVAIADHVNSLAWRYLPLFLIGAIVAVALPALRAGVARMPAVARNLAGAGALLLAGIVLAARSETLGWLPAGVVLDELGTATPAITAALVVMLVILWAPLAWLLQTPVFRWLGRVSFSLYLVHVPILLSVNAVLAAWPWWVAAAVSLPLALGAAELFARFVEGPSHDASKRAGRWARGLVDRPASRTL